MQYFAKKKKKGFTLIELLVVIAIIGILATIVVVNVNGARTKAKDTAIKGSLESLRSAAELIYDASGNYASTCSTTTNPDYARIYAAVVAQGQTPTCNPLATSWAAAANLNAGGSYCVDSTGNAKTYPTITTLGSATVCP